MRRLATLALLMTTAAHVLTNGAAATPRQWGPFPTAGITAVTSGDRTTATVSVKVSCPKPPTDGSPYFGTFLSVTTGPATNVWNGRDYPGYPFTCTGSTQTVDVQVWTYDRSAYKQSPSPTLTVGATYKYKVDLVARTSTQSVNSTTGRLKMSGIQAAA